MMFSLQPGTSSCYHEVLTCILCIEHNFLMTFNRNWMGMFANWKAGSNAISHVVYLKRYADFWLLNLVLTYKPPSSGLRGLIARQRIEFLRYNGYGTGCVLNAKEQPTSKLLSAVTGSSTFSVMRSWRLRFVLFSLHFALLIGVKLEEGVWDTKRIPYQGIARVSNCLSIKSIIPMN